MIRTLRFEPALAGIVGVDHIRLDGDNVRELVSGLCAVSRGRLNPVPGQGKHLLEVHGFGTVESLTRPLGDDEADIHIGVAVAAEGLHGAKQGGTLQIAIGVVLIVAAVYTAGAALAWEAPMLGGMTTAGSVAFAGTMMVAGGLLAVLSPAPQMDMPNFNTGGDNNPEASKYLGSPKNTVKVGTRIPIICGRHMHGGHILSMNIDAKDVAV